MNISISIHAPRAGGDGTPTATATTLDADFNPRPPCGGRHGRWDIISGDAKISIHAPRAGGDGGEIMSLYDIAKFQSTPPVRGAT